MFTEFVALVILYSSNPTKETHSSVEAVIPYNKRREKTWRQTSIHANTNGLLYKNDDPRAVLGRSKTSAAKSPAEDPGLVSCRTLS